MSASEQSIGSVGDEYRPDDARHDHYAAYARARREEPVFFSPALGVSVVTRYADVQEVLGNPEAYSLAGVLRGMDELVPEAIAEIRNSLPAPPDDQQEYGDDSRKRAREPIRRAFLPERVGKLESYLRDQVESLVEAFVAGGSGDVMSRLARKLPIHAKATILGLEPDDVEAVVEGSYSLTYLNSGSSSIEPSSQIAHARQVAAYQRLLDTYALRRRAEPGDDLFSTLISAVAPGDGPLDPVQRRTVVESMTGLIGAGQSTTTAMVGTAIWHLTRNREQWELLRQRPELTPGAVEEVLRYDMPLQGLPRRTTRPVRLGGKDLAEGTRLMVMYASANRDEAEFDRPNEFDITRTPKRHFTFGYGPRACVGMHLARTLLRITLLTLSRRLPGLRPAGEDALTFVPGMHRVISRLEVVW